MGGAVAGPEEPLAAATRGASAARAMTVECARRRRVSSVADRAAGVTPRRGSAAARSSSGLSRMRTTGERESEVEEAWTEEIALDITRSVWLRSQDVRLKVAARPCSAPWSRVGAGAAVVARAALGGRRGSTGLGVRVEDGFRGSAA